MVDRLFSRSEIRSNEELPPAWKRAEEYVVKKFQLQEDHAPWHDARHADGEPIEIKSCAAKHADDSLGEFKIWDSQLTELIGEGRIALLLYAHDDCHSVMASHFVNPHDLRYAGCASWVDHPTMGVRYLWRIAWPEVIPLEEVEIGARHHFAEHYPEQEAEDVFFLCESDKLIRLY